MFFFRSLRLLFLLIVVVAAVAGWWWRPGATTSTEGGESSTVKTFRRAPGRTGTALPGVGVYAHRQSGSEGGGIGPAAVKR